jgi:hypothetical protein
MLLTFPMWRKTRICGCLIVQFFSGCNNSAQKTDNSALGDPKIDQVNVLNQGVNATSAKASAPVDPCTIMCRHSDRLACSGLAQCGESCRQLVALPDCAAEMAAALACFIKEPDDHWQCGDDGLAAIREGYCEREQAAYVNCLQRSEK